MNELPLHKDSRASVFCCRFHETNDRHHNGFHPTQTERGRVNESFSLLTVSSQRLPSQNWLCFT